MIINMHNIYVSRVLDDYAEDVRHAATFINECLWRTINTLCLRKNEVSNFLR